MRVLVHDLSLTEEKQYIGTNLNNKDIIVHNSEKMPHKCIGCFGCWIKNPGECVVKDGNEYMGKYIGNCEELIIVSKCYYGEFSPYVKTIIDRSIPVCQPYFEKRQGKMHHRLRYDNHPRLTVYYYGEDLTDDEKSTFENRVHGMKINFGASNMKIIYLNKKEELGGRLKW